jgi:protein-tyrosine phosphatase
MSQDTDPHSTVQEEAGDVLVAEEELFSRRVLPLEGGVNFRDMGGYPTEDGRRVRWGKIYRSGTMFGLTRTDYDILATLGIRRLIDLRTPEERVAEPNHWAEAAGISIWSRDYKSTFGVLRKLLASDLPTVEAAQGAIKAGYRRLAFEHMPAYRALFESLHKGDVPLIFNCSAGKDRTGAAAALVLAALGVGREAILRDYRETNRILDLSRLARGRSASAQSGDSMLSRVPKEVLAVVMGTDPSYLACLFDVIQERCGSMEGYLLSELGIGGEELQAIRDSLLE